MPIQTENISITVNPVRDLLAYIIFWVKFGENIGLKLERRSPRQAKTKLHFNFPPICR